MSEWMDIETAPKDGTAIMLVSPDGEVGFGTIEVSEYSGEPHGRAAWIGEHGPYLGGYRAQQATHWMPLPSPPA